MRTLVVEDFVQMRKMVRRMLEQMQRFDAIDEAIDGEVAWRKIVESETNYDIVICDVGLPRMDGLTFLKRCREREEYRYIPFVMISESPHEPMLASALGELGANDFVVKPFSFQLFVERVEMVLRRMRSREERLYRKAEQLTETGAINDALDLIGEWERDNCMYLAKWYNLRGECLMRNGALEDAAEQFEKAMAINRIFIKAFRNYATVQQELGNIDKVIDTLKHIEELAPVDAERTIRLAEMLLQRGEEQQGREYLEKVLKRGDIPNRASILKKVSAVYLESGLFADAEKVYRLALGEEPEDIENINKLAITLRQQGKFEEAEMCYLNALKVHPRHPGLYHNLGVLYMARHDGVKAKRCFERALTFDPKSEQTQMMLAQAAKLLARK
ncbi:MAG: tetratricopeptide repeat protein [Syntrophobacteraceae bacterium]|nr:response regulator [Desulfobacteraceae bacterium]